jgi:hypothetical protein
VKFSSKESSYNKNNMKITICGSIAFYDKMMEKAEELRRLGHQVELPPAQVKDENGDMISVKDYYLQRKNETDESSWIWERKKEAMIRHFKNVEWGDAVLILNYDKNNIPNYIGANTFLEMGVALYLGKKIFLLNEIPEVENKEEILGMKPVVINNNLKKIE